MHKTGATYKTTTKQPRPSKPSGQGAKPASNSKFQTPLSAHFLK